MTTHLARLSDLAEARERAIAESFGGPNTYALLEQRNPELKMILNAGIVAGLRQAGEAWPE